MSENITEVVKHGAPVPGYCDGCHKIKDGKCTVYASPYLKVAASRGNILGCAFSPIARKQSAEEYYRKNPERQRVGQQKQKKRKK
ncbi:MAG: hypothetical protein JRJ29_00345 [Deltaproteobacteria bacterium]|nr:hypothetical protein [Deltaproteobacteria bacterium]MBW2081616.1 hypothetical protein [Deltaproteobacteria bacterium]